MRRSSYEYIIPALLALGLCIGLGFSIPLLSTRYLLSLEETEILPPDFFLYYADLDHDGRSEIIQIFYNSTGNLSVRLRDFKEADINQFNLAGRLTKVGSTLELYDIDEDGITDIFICTEKNDSIYLNIIDNVYGHPTTSKVFALDRINNYNDNGDYNFIPGGLRDLDGDGSQEFIMAINGGHSLQPRRVYAINYSENKVLRSPISGAAIYELGFFDLDGDGGDEIVLNTSATDNFSDPFPFMDTTSYLMVLDEDLSFYRPPLVLSEMHSWSTVRPFIYGGERFLLTYVRQTGYEDVQTFLAIYDDSLRPLIERDFHHDPRDRFYFWSKSDRLGLEDLKIVTRDRSYSIDFKLQFVDSARNKVPLACFNRPIQVLNLDGHGTEEFVFQAHNEMIVTAKDLAHLTSVDIRWNALNPRILISLRENGIDDPVLAIQMDQELFYLSYYQNGWFRYRFLLYPGIFLLIFGLFYFLGTLQNRLVRSRYEKDRLINQLQLQAIKNQLDPHFTYNALNAVGSLIYKGEKDLAYQYLKGLTDLLRLVSGDTSDVTWTLADELGFVRRFLEIEKLRFRDKFVYSLKVQEELEDLKVPKLSVLTFVENATKHGLHSKKSDRRLDITSESYEGGLRIAIADNGVGRAASVKTKAGNSGGGIQMMKKYLKQFNEATGMHARFEITDLYKNGNDPAGTLVEIYIV